MVDGGLGIILQGKVSPFFFLCYFNTLGPVVWKPISANHGLNFNLGFIFFCSKAFSQIIFTIRASIHYIAGKRNKTEFAF